MSILKESDRKVLKAHFANLVAPVRLLVFTEASGCPYCHQTRQLVEELVELSDRIELEILDRASEPELTRRYGVDKVPAIIVLTGGTEPADTGIRFFGIPSGYEFATLVDDIIAVSRGEARLGAETRQWLAALTRPLHLQVFVTPTCPYCPRAVSLAHRLALASPLIRADMIEATEFPALADRYNVYGVPRTVINDTIAVEGAVPEGQLLEYLKEAAAQAQPVA